ncbi:hypothetical protein [Comamonas thiooxydans]|uniref:hypothetical protein n=1 Tax=Comamonas thiooxydans TaxID=363952 RepID=UPI003D049C8D
MSAPDHSGFAPHTVTAKPDIFSHAVHVIGPEGNKRNKAPATALKQLGARAQKKAPGSYHPEHIQGNRGLSQRCAFDAMTLEFAKDSRGIPSSTCAAQRFFTNSRRPIY